MNQILRFDWLPERARWSYLARPGLPAVSRKKIFSQKSYNKSFIDQACSVKMAGYCSEISESVPEAYGDGNESSSDFRQSSDDFEKTWEVFG